MAKAVRLWVVANSKVGIEALMDEKFGKTCVAEIMNKVAQFLSCLLKRQIGIKLADDKKSLVA